jgi:hypothetical protein
MPVVAELAAVQDLRRRRNENSPPLFQIPFWYLARCWRHCPTSR